MDDRNLEHDDVKKNQLTEFGDDDWTNGTCGLCHPLGPSLFELPSLAPPSIPESPLPTHR
jgi:hypothetical protein